jgi:hypothetical protein
MPLKFLDSFDDRYFANGQSYAQFHGKWDVVFEDSSGSYSNSISQVNGRTGKACKIGGNSYLQKTGYDTPSLIWGMALKVESAPVAETTIVEIEAYTGTGTGTIKYKLSSSLTIKIYVDDNFVIESNSSITTNTFYYVESSNLVTSYSTALKINGVNWLSTVPIWPVSWAEAGITKVKFSGNVIVDDLYIYTDSTSAFLYPIKIDAVVPNSNGTADTNAWQSINYQDVDESLQPNNYDINDYDESNTTSPSRVSYNFTDKSNATIFGIQSMSWVTGKWNGSGSASNVNITALTRISSSYYESNVKSVTSYSSPTSNNYQLVVGIWENNPNTNTSWTTTTYNSAEFGVKAEPVTNNIGRLAAITLELGYEPSPITPKITKTNVEVLVQPAITPKVTKTNVEILVQPAITPKVTKTNVEVLVEPAITPKITKTNVEVLVEPAITPKVTKTNVEVVFCPDPAKITKTNVEVLVLPAITPKITKTNVEVVFCPDPARITKTNVEVLVQPAVNEKVTKHNIEVLVEPAAAVTSRIFIIS